MKTIAIASGKGGTGKTTLSTNLVYVMAQCGQNVVYADCDVEEPNGHLFLKPVIQSKKPVGMMVPQVHRERCVHCGQCGEICAYSAIICLGSETLVFPEMCHSCGGCWLVCPEGAISQTLRKMGTVEKGHAGNVGFVQGTLDIGEAMSPPVIRAVKEEIPEADWLIVDAPPGTSCPVIESIKGSDYVVLVTEPTPFGLHDLTLAVEMVRALRYPFGVVINRADFAFQDIWAYCQRQRIPILAEIPDDRRIAEAYSQGKMISAVQSDYAGVFRSIQALIEKEMESAKVGVS
ncbi:MAG: ATP-binding protein [bacterium]|nr:ATP-binding protein [bacterium]